MEMVEEVVIIGGGIAGLASAVALKRVGIKALVLERSEELRGTGAALTLFPNAWLALDALGVSHKLTSVYPIIKKGYITNLATEKVQEMTFADESENKGARSVHRKTLVMALAEELDSDSIRFSCKITSIETQGNGESSIAIVRMEDGSIVKAKILIGCDGVHSAVAKWLGLAEPVQSGRSAVRGLSVFPEGHGLKSQFAQYIGAGQRAGYIPLNDTQIYWFITFASPTKGAYLSGDPEDIKREVIENQAARFPSKFLDIVRHSDGPSLSCAPLLFRKPWNVAFGTLNRGCVAVCGDAMHPMTPDLGQGGCAALEDSVVLGRHLGRQIRKRGEIAAWTNADVAEALGGYVEERRWRVTRLIAGSFMSGWIQHGASFWGLKFFRDVLFYKFFAKRVFGSVMDYDCGELVD